MLMTIELAFMSFLALPLTIAGGPIAGPTAGAVAGGIGGAWAGTTALVTDGFAGNEHRNEALVADAQYWLAHQDRLMKETANFNLRHLFNGGRLGSGYDLADFFQFGSFLIDPDPQDLHRLTSVQQTSIALDRIWREDRVYIIAQMDPCNDGMLLRDIVGDVIEDSKMVCLPDDYPDLTFYVYSAPKDPKAAATSMTQERWYNDGLPRTHWARNVPGRELIDNGWNAMNWTVSATDHCAILSLVSY